MSGSPEANDTQRSPTRGVASSICHPSVRAPCIMQPGTDGDSDDYLTHKRAAASCSCLVSLTPPRMMIMSRFICVFIDWQSRRMTGKEFTAKDDCV